MKMYCKMLYMGLLIIFTFGVAWQETVYAADGYVYVTQWGSFGSGPTQFNAPLKLAIDRNANILYVCDTFNRRVVKYTLDGNYLGQLTLQYYPSGIAVAADGTVYAAQGDPYGYMRVFNPSGREIRGWRLHRPTSITLDSTGNVYVSWSSHVPGDTNGITKYTPSGTVLATWPEFEYDGLNDIEYDAVHNCIFGTNSYVNKIMKIQMDGSRTVWATVPSDPSCWYPYCLGLDNNGDILVAIHHCDNLKKFDYAGNLLMQWGSSGTGNGQFNKTGGVVVDNDGYVYVADTYNHRIQKFSPSGRIKVAMPSFSPDGGDSTEPKDVTITCATPDAVIHYTTKGADPTESDPTVVSGGTVRVDHSLTLKAKAWKTGRVPSDIKNASYVVVLPWAPIAYYSFNNPSDPGHDDSGNGHNLTMPGTVTTVPGLSGNAIHFEAGTSAPYVSTSGMNYPTSKGFSVGYWFKIGSSTDQIAVRDYWCHRDSGETFGLRYDPTQSKADFFVRHAFSPPTIVEALVTVNAGDWVHLLGTYDPVGYVITLYVNDVLVGQQNMPGPMRNEIAPYLYINGSCHGTTQGTIDEVKIYGCVVIPKIECNRDIVGDLNHDCYVNFLDFALMAENWLSCSNPMDPACGPYTIDKGLLGYWSFNERSGNIAGDSTGNGNAGIITGASWTSGKAGSALDFNGSGDYVDIANTPILNPTQALTVTAWINVRSFTTPWSPVVTHSDWCTNGGTQGYAMEFNLENSGIRFIIDGPGDEGVISEVVPVTNDAWTFVVGIYDGSKVQLFVNATPSTPKPCSISQFQSTGNVYIGRSVAAPERYFSGAIDEVRIYNRALTESEVQYLYRNP